MLRLPTKFFGRPGPSALRRRPGAARTSSRSARIPRIILPDVPIARQSDSWSLFWNCDQYLVVEPGRPDSRLGLLRPRGHRRRASEPDRMFPEPGLGGSARWPCRAATRGASVGTAPTRATTSARSCKRAGPDRRRPRRRAVLQHRPSRPGATSRPTCKSSCRRREPSTRRSSPASGRTSTSSSPDKLLAPLAPPGVAAQRDFWTPTRNAFKLQKCRCPSSSGRLSLGDGRAARAVGTPRLLVRQHTTTA